MSKREALDSYLLKRVVDVIVAVVALIALSPFLLLLASLIAMTLGQPVLFRQDRLGLKGKVFTIYKFRTMANTYDCNGNMLPDEVRLTKLGEVLRRASLDELPELWNVLCGSMSLVGPRPLLVQYLPLYTKDQARRHNVKPGITGLAQVSGRNSLSWEDRFKLDVWYVEHCSFALDVKILLLTIVKVGLREGISGGGSATMEPFRGSSR